MDALDRQQIDAAKRAALAVLLHNAHGPFQGLLVPQAGATRNPTPGT